LKEGGSPGRYKEGGSPMYCKKCCIVFEADTCPVCGNKDLREPAAEDWCYLAEKDVVWGGMLEDVLRQKAIPVFVRRRLGAGMTLKIGQSMERVIMYVPYSCLARARELEEELFPQNL